MTFRLALVPEPLHFAAGPPRGDARFRPRTPVAVADEIYRLALGMLWHPADAEYAKSEILDEARKLGVEPGDRGSRVTLLAVAVRHLLECSPSLFERQGWTFEALAEDLRRGSDEPLPPKAFGEHSQALIEEVKLGCWQTMLLCLDRQHRIAYLLSTLEDLEASTAASVLGRETEDYTARASAAEGRIRSFTESHCGLVNRAHPCRCSRRLGRALVTGRVDPDELLFARLLPPSAKAS